MATRLSAPDIGPDVVAAVADRSMAWILGAALVVGLAVAARVVAISARGVHWDEGVHAYYAWEFLSTGEFAYEPWRHGPLLYFVSVPAMVIFGESVLAGRTVVAVLSLGVFPALWFLREELPAATLAFAGVVLAVHPYVLSTARFYRTDAILATFLLLAVGAYARYYRTGTWYWAAALGASAGLAFAAKEIAFLVAPAIVAAVFVVVHFAARFETGSTRAAVRTYLRPRYLPVTAVSFFAVLVVLYGGWPPAPIESVGQFVDGLTFWLSEGREESGTVTYYLARLGVGTPILFSLAATGTLGTVLRPRASWFRWLFLAWALVPAAVLSLIGDQSWWNVVVVAVPMVLLAGYGLADLLDAGGWLGTVVADRLGFERSGRTRPAREQAQTVDRLRHAFAGAPVPTPARVVLPALAALLVVAAPLGIVPTPGAVGPIERPDDSPLTQIEGVTAPDEPDARDQAFDAARAAALETDCGVVAGPGTYEWPARWWVRDVGFEHTADLDAGDLPAVVVSGEPLTRPGHAYRVRRFDGYRTVVPRGGC